MRQLIITAFVSIDGVMEAPGGEDGYRNTGWTQSCTEHLDAPYANHKGPEQDDAAALLMGRVSYEAFAPFWPKADFFAGYNAMPRYVVSTTLQSDDDRWPATILPSIDAVAKLREGDGGPIIVHGSATLGAALADADLVDRYHLLRFPVLLGAGRRLFSEADRDMQRLKLVEHATYDNGLQWQKLDVVR